MPGEARAGSAGRFMAERRLVRKNSRPRAFGCVPSGVQAPLAAPPALMADRPIGLFSIRTRGEGSTVCDYDGLSRIKWYRELCRSAGNRNRIFHDGCNGS